MQLKPCKICKNHLIQIAEMPEGSFCFCMRCNNQTDLCANRLEAISIWNQTN